MPQVSKPLPGSKGRLPVNSLHESTNQCWQAKVLYMYEYVSRAGLLYKSMKNKDHGHAFPCHGPLSRVVTEESQHDLIPVDMSEM